VCRAVLQGRHPDLVIVERVGASISIAQAREVTRLSMRSPLSAAFQVLVLVDFHLAGPVAPALLKTIEEPPPSTIIVILADSVPADFVTIASRCLTVQFSPISEQAVMQLLESEGSEPAEAASIAKAAQGRLDRARLLRADPSFAARSERWRTLPAALDGTGATVSRLAAALLEASNEPAEVVKAQQAEELTRLSEEAQAAGDRGVPGRAAIEARHRRELRRARADDLLAGLAVLLGVYRSRLSSGASAVPVRSAIQAIELIDEAAARLKLNVNEPLLLEWLLLRLDRLGAMGP
ncbi:MAG: hypothetical protein ACRDZT_06045, partial [Acidimicrobiales bacterium]